MTTYFVVITKFKKKNIMDLKRSKIVKICTEKQPKNASKFCLKIKQNAII